MTYSEILPRVSSLENDVKSAGAWVVGGAFRILQACRLAPKLPSRPVREQVPLPSQVVAEKIVDDYYPQRAGRAAAVRSRAQGGYTIAAAIAAAIITAGALSEIDERPWWTQALAGLALVFWLVTVVLYAQAVAGHVLDESAPAQPLKTQRAIAREFLFEIEFERATLERRLDFALWTTIIAVCATLLAVAVALWPSPPSPSLSSGVVALKASGQKALAPLCGRQPSKLRGSFDPDELGDPFISVEIPGDEDKTVRDAICPRATGETLEVRTRDVLSARVAP